MATSLHFRRCQFDRLADSNVGHAAANTASHHRVEVLVGRIREVLEQRGGLHDLSRLAVAALRNLQLEPRGLQWMFALWIETFNRRDPCSRDRTNRRNAGARCASFHMHGASAAKTDSATEFRSSETKLVSDYPQQGRVVRTTRRNGAAVEIECGHDSLGSSRFRSMVCRPLPADA